MAQAASVRTPVSGVVARWLAPAGSRIAAGTPVVVVEAVKAEFAVRTPVAGVLGTWRVRPGALVGADDVLVQVVEEPAGARRG